MRSAVKFAEFHHRVNENEKEKENENEDDGEVPPFSPLEKTRTV